MSWKMMLGVHHLPVKLTPAEYRVAMVLADHADEEGRNCWPSQATIVAESQLSIRTVRDAQHALVEKGVIEVDRPATATDSARWRVTVEIDFRSRPYGYSREAKSAGGSGNSCRGVRQNLPEGPAKSASEPVLEPVQEPRREVPPSSVPPIVTISGPQHVRSPKGSRLADDWQPSDSDLDFAKSLGLAPEAVLDQFTDYWHAKAGPMAFKLDWHATWRNWCRKEAASRPHSNGHAKESRHAWVTKALRGELPHEAWEDAL